MHQDGIIHPKRYFQKTSRIFGVILLAYGAYLIVDGLKEIKLASESSKWPKAEGYIIESRMEQKRGTEWYGWQIKKETFYTAVIFYEYQVGDHSYRGSRIAFGDASFFQKDSPIMPKLRLKSYPSGKQVPVFYRPNKPQMSVLEPGPSQLMWLGPGLGLTLILLAFVTAIALPRNRSLPAETLGSVSRKNLTNR